MLQFESLSKVITVYLDRVQGLIDTYNNNEELRDFWVNITISIVIVDTSRTIRRYTLGQSDEEFWDSVTNSWISRPVPFVVKDYIPDIET